MAEGRPGAGRSRHRPDRPGCPPGLTNNESPCRSSPAKQQFWQPIEAARNQASNPSDGEAVAREVTSLVASRSAEEIVAAEQVLWDLMVDSCTNPLWVAAYIANGGCSDDGFDYFRGWLFAQGRGVFERAVADPDALGELPIVQASAAGGIDLDGEDMLGIARPLALPSFSSTGVPGGSSPARQVEGRRRGALWHGPTPARPSPRCEMCRATASRARCDGRRTCSAPTTCCPGRTASLVRGGSAGA
ncbi:DUF4240 domain-containing protein [Streptomyces sp. NPDC001858]